MGELRPFTIDRVTVQNPNLRDERGIFYIGTAMALGKLAAGVTVVGLLAAGPIYSMYERNSSTTASVDLNKGHSSSETNILEVNPSESIDIATAYYASKADVSGIEVTLKKELPGPIDPTYTVPYNTEVRTVGPIDFKLPFDAVQPTLNPEGETDFLVDASRMTVTVGLSDAPIYKDYTINSGGKNFDDREGFRKSLLLGMRVLGINNAPNVLEDAVNMGKVEIARGNQREVAKKCPDQLIPEMPELIEEALKKNLMSMKQDGVFGEVKLTNKFVFTETPVPDAVKKAIADNSLTATKPTINKIQFDEVSCTKEKQQ